ncbi:glycosyl transferase family 2 [Stanieria cyanosphaera PCC 7437]|uniref:Glycosyl transferase family 2 n=1 Tax=Stanieria cyanosphaera (strain ATCC 29371 / PCC 7437) TaxID=111780 RepID=K9XUQ1_STAC7|nr:glycosyltransferase family 2 protein [Stanieria cyanosphaera]AFZ36330.1 glycosyl transferase family 2 [Stanieria cyanosphaera PCC 7437]
MNVAVKEPVYIIIPIHNRKQISLKCLENLNQCGDLQRYHVVVVDDGSTDGTTEAINCLYPDVIVLPGDGNLWWTGAIKKGMEYSYQQGAEYFIWLNDDTLSNKGAIQSLVSVCSLSPNKIVSGQCYATTELKMPTYGGQRKKGLSLNLLYAPQTEVIKCDCMSGNFVCLPRSIIEKIDFPPNEKFPHCLADIVYTWEAKKAGYQLEVLGCAIAVCEFNPLFEGWSSNPIPMKEHWKIINSPKSNLYPPAYWFYSQTFYGWMGIIIFIQGYFRLLLFTIARLILPLYFLKKLKICKNKIITNYKKKLNEQ